MLTLLHGVGIYTGGSRLSSTATSKKSAAVGNVWPFHFRPRIRNPPRVGCRHCHLGNLVGLVSILTYCHFRERAPEGYRQFGAKLQATAAPLIEHGAKGGAGNQTLLQARRKVQTVILVKVALVLSPVAFAVPSIFVGLDLDMPLVFFGGGFTCCVPLVWLAFIIRVHSGRSGSHGRMVVVSPLSRGQRFPGSPPRASLTMTVLFSPEHRSSGLFQQRFRARPHFRVATGWYGEALRRDSRVRTRLTAFGFRRRFMNPKFHHRLFGRSCRVRCDSVRARNILGTFLNVNDTRNPLPRTHVGTAACLHRSVYFHIFV